MRKQSKDIRQFIISNVSAHSRDIVRLVCEEFGISRQAANSHLRKMVEEGQVTATGATRNRKYWLVPVAKKFFGLPITPDLEENRVWREQVEPLLKGVPENILDICYYGFGEMFNNVIDHSGGDLVSVHITYTPDSIVMQITDNGVGVFNKLKRKFGLENEQHAMLELTKGKMTTDPERHTGQGIFFTSRMFDIFYLLSGTYSYGHKKEGDEWFLEHDSYEINGTAVVMTIAVDSKRTAKEVFDRYASKDGPGRFDTTHVPITLAKFGEENLVSRSEAKRLLARLDSFKEVILDFNGVSTIGHSFADEIFRVYRNSHPQVLLWHINANKEVAKMIESVEAGEVANN